MNYVILYHGELPAWVIHSTHAIAHVLDASSRHTPLTSPRHHRHQQQSYHTSSHVVITSPYHATCPSQPHRDHLSDTSPYRHAVHHLLPPSITHYTSTSYCHIVITSRSRPLAISSSNHCHNYRYHRCHLPGMCFGAPTQWRPAQRYRARPSSWMLCP